MTSLKGKAGEAYSHFDGDGPADASSFRNPDKGGFWAMAKRAISSGASDQDLADAYKAWLSGAKVSVTLTKEDMQGKTRVDMDLPGFLADENVLSTRAKMKADDIAKVTELVAMLNLARAGKQTSDGKDVDMEAVRASLTATADTVWKKIRSGKNKGVALSVRPEAESSAKPSERDRKAALKVPSVVPRLKHTNEHKSGMWKFTISGISIGSKDISVSASAQTKRDAILMCKAAAARAAGL